jgi:hypothetical protein
MPILQNAIYDKIIYINQVMEMIFPCFNTNKIKITLWVYRKGMTEFFLMDDTQTNKR